MAPHACATRHAHPGSGTKHLSGSVVTHRCSQCQRPLRGPPSQHTRAHTGPDTHAAPPPPWESLAEWAPKRPWMGQSEAPQHWGGLPPGAHSVSNRGPPPSLPHQLCHRTESLARKPAASKQVLEAPPPVRAEGPLQGVCQGQALPPPTSAEFCCHSEPEDHQLLAQAPDR